MATIRKKVLAEKTRFEAIIRRQISDQERHRESRTFDTRQEAQQWVKRREDELKNPAARARQIEPGSPTLADLIEWYSETFGPLNPWSRTKQSQLEFLGRHAIGKADAQGLTTAILVDHIRSRRAAGASPSTAANDLIWIGCVLRAVKDSQECPNIDPTIVRDARIACKKLRLIGRSRRRDVRPTPEQLLLLDDYFRRRDQRSTIPMRDIMWFAIASSRRQEEICRLRWKDNEPQHRTGMVRDAKHPRKKDGNHRRFKYTAEAWDIVQRQSKNSEFIFPYNPQSISDAFTNACHFLGIENLRFHDLRHEATSRLFERGHTIPQVSQFTLHESWDELKRYTHLLKKNLRDLPEHRSHIR